MTDVERNEQLDSLQVMGESSPAPLAPPPCVYTLKLIRVMSFLIVTQRRVVGQSGSTDQLAEFYRKTLLMNVLMGWWGFPFGLVWTPLALYRNWKAFKKLHTLAADGLAAAGWFPDPTGRHGARYWDGTRWTDRVSDVATDHLGNGSASS